MLKLMNMYSDLKQDPLLTRAYLRLDLSGLTDFAGTVTTLAKEKWFEQMVGRHDIVESEKEDRDEPVKVHRFSGLKGFPKGAYIDVSERIVSITLNKEVFFPKMDSALFQLIINVWEVLKKNDSYTQIVRVGYRKIWARKFSQDDNPDDYFAYFDQGLMKGSEDEALAERQYIDKFWSPKYRSTVNSIRSVKTVNKELDLMFSLDLDVYKRISEEEFSRPKEKEFSMDLEQLSNFLSDIWQRSFVEHYIEECNEKVVKDKEEQPVSE